MGFWKKLAKGEATWDDAKKGVKEVGRAVDKAVFQPIVRTVVPQKSSSSSRINPNSPLGRRLSRFFRRPNYKTVMDKIRDGLRSTGRTIDKKVTQPIAKEVKHIVKPVAGEVAMRAKDLANSKAVKQAGDAIGDGLRSFDKNVIQPVSTSKTMKNIQGKAQQAADYVGDEVRNIPGSLKNMAQAAQDPEKKGFYPLPYFTKHIPDAVADVIRGGGRVLEGMATLDGGQFVNGLKTAGSGILGAGEHTIKGGILPVWNAISRKTDGRSSVQEYDDETDDTVVTVGDKEDVQTGTVDDIEPGTVASGGAQTAARSQEFPDVEDVPPEGLEKTNDGRNTIGVPSEPVKTKSTGPTDASQSSGGMTALTGATPEQLYADFYAQFKDTASPLEMVMYKMAADSGDVRKMQQIMNKVKARG